MVPVASPDIRPRDGPGTSGHSCTLFMDHSLGMQMLARYLSTGSCLCQWGEGSVDQVQSSRLSRLCFHVLLTLGISTNEPPAISGFPGWRCGSEATSLQGLSLLMGAPKGQGGIPQSHKSKMSAHQYVRSLFR